MDFSRSASSVEQLHDALYIFLDLVTAEKATVMPSSKCQCSLVVTASDDPCLLFFVESLVRANENGLDTRILDQRYQQPQGSSVGMIGNLCSR